MDLKLQLHRGNGSRKKLIYANCRMVVYIAKQYLRRGLSLPDLLQVKQRCYFETSVPFCHTSFIAGPLAALLTLAILDWDVRSCLVTFLLMKCI